MAAEQGFPKVRQVVLDSTDARALAEFYRQLLGLAYRPGDEPPPDGEPDPLGQDWLVLRDPGTGSGRIAFQQVTELPEVTWPAGPVPQQLHLDLTVACARPTSTPSTSGRWRWAPGCSTTAPAIPRSRCASTPTRRPPVLHLRGQRA